PPHRLLPPALFTLSFCFERSGHHRDLHSFPTRRSSDLCGVATELLGSPPRHRTARSLPRRPAPALPHPGRPAGRRRPGPGERRRSEEHTSELQSRENLVCRLLLEKKNYISAEPTMRKSV